MKKLSIVIVNWNTSEEISDCLLSIKKFANLKNTNIFVVDNNSADDSVAVIERKFSWVKLIKNEENLGFGKANNQVLKKLKSEFVFILNPDTRIEKDTLSLLQDFFKQHQDFGLCGPQLLNRDGSIQDVGYYQKFPGLLQILFFYTQIRDWSYGKHWLKKNLLSKKVKEDDFFLVDQIPGACMFGKVDVLRKVGFFDESFPLWFEDVDLCYRLRQTNYKLALIPEVKMTHLGGSSFQKWQDYEAKEIRLFKSLFHFFDLHYNFLSRALVRCIIWLDLSLLILRKVGGQLKNPNTERRRFIEQKWRVLKALLV